MDIKTKQQRGNDLRKSLNYAYLKAGAPREAIDKFKIQATKLLSSIKTNESEEFHKNSLSDFLKDTYYKDKHYINVKDKQDLVIHNDKKSTSSVGVIIEVKRPSNKSEMVSCNNLNKKSLQELVLYYLRERITHKNLQLKHLIITNINEWFIFDARIFERCFAENKDLVKLFNDFENKTLAGNKTSSFYDDIAEPAIELCKEHLIFTYFNLADYQPLLENTDKENDNPLIPLFKILSPEHLLKLSFSNDANSLNEEFYNELLHIIGLEEVKEGGKKLIKRKSESSRYSASFLEQAISKIKGFSEFKQGVDLFDLAIELCITWVNRILFLKLLEAQLMTYHKKDKLYQFFNVERLTCFSDLNHLFFEILARTDEQRDQDTQQNFSHIPYLNSSLFEETELERRTLNISVLRRLSLPILSTSVLKNEQGHKLTGELDILSYLFSFLDAYDFSNHSKEEIKENNKSLISASVLGLIFEKINGYKDGSFFTPSIITMYMSRETMRLAVLQKFNELKSLACETFDDLKSTLKINTKESRKEANDIVNSIKVCDPAVGSGHFLVSVLNEFIAIKSELGILIYHGDENYTSIRKWQISVENDEFKIVHATDDKVYFEYYIESKESQRVQKTLFHEKQKIIENCLFGVDINPNSVKICRLRLWIELLKNAYYNDDGNLETLPNIDINIQCGNSLISRFKLDEDLKKNKDKIERYKSSIYAYQSVTDKVEKRAIEKTLTELKDSFFKGLIAESKEEIKLKDLTAQLKELNNLDMFSTKEKQIQKIELEIAKIETKINNKVYDNAFEWRFIFPEALNTDGDFIGFDVIIGNPPYIQIQNFSGQDVQTALQNCGYETFERTGDIYALFIENGINLLKQNGLLSFITSNKWMRAGYGESLRGFLAKKTQPLKLIDFAGYQVFDSATVDSNILITQKSLPSLPFVACAVQKDYNAEIDLTHYFSEHSQQMPLMTANAWVISSDIQQQIKAKIEAIGTPLKEWDININYGIKTGFNEAFIIDTETKERLCSEDVNSEKIIKPVLRGRNIKRYQANWEGLWIIFIPWHFPLQENQEITGSSKEAEQEFKKQYPAIYQHLTKFKNDLLTRNKAETGIRYEWYALQRCAATYYKEFEKEKIVWGNLALDAQYSLADKGVYVNAPCPIITPANKYILAVLNSPVSDYYIRKLGVTRNGGYFEYKPMFVELLPVPKLSTSEQKPYIKLVDKIFKAKKAGQDTHDLETQIDTLVYALYGLSEAEIAIVAGEKITGG